jgi:hypothetical protein
LPADLLDFGGSALSPVEHTARWATIYTQHSVNPEILEHAPQGVCVAAKLCCLLPLVGSLQKVSFQTSGPPWIL